MTLIFAAMKTKGLYVTAIDVDGGVSFLKSKGVSWGNLIGVDAAGAERYIPIKFLSQLHVGGLSRHNFKAVQSQMEQVLSKPQNEPVVQRGPVH